MFGSDHAEMQLLPAQWAARILDSARLGDIVSPWQVNRALMITGDLPKSFNLSGIHYEKSIQNADAP